MGIPLGSGPLGSGPTGPGSGFSVMPMKQTLKGHGTDFVFKRASGNARLVPSYA